VLESITQELPVDIKASLEPISQLDNHFATVRRALKNQSSRPALEQKRAKAKQFVKESKAQIQSNKELLAELQPALELKIARKATLEAELKNLIAEIEADKKKIAEPSKSSGLAGGRTEHVGFGGLPTKPLADGFLVWASKPSPRAQHDGDGIRACREASRRRTRGGIAWLASGGRGVRQRRGRPMARPTNIT
jgi:DNA repair exonuclease SbcCD ATPase subunit